MPRRALLWLPADLAPGDGTMGDVTAVMMDCITEKSGHTVTPMAVSVCLTPAAPAPLPLPYPVVGSSIEGIGDAPMRTKINGALIGTVGSVLKTCHGNEPGTLKEVVSLNTTGPCFIIMGAPVVLCELGMMGITGSMCMQNKAPTPGAGGSASDAGGSGGAGGGGGEGSGSGGDGHGPGGPAGGGGAGGGGSNSGAAGPGASSGAAGEHQCQNGHPVDVVTGYVVDELIDISLPGVIPLVWKRLYSSSRRSDTTATLGAGWAHGFEQRIVEEERTITLREAEGRLVWFAKIKPGESTFHRRERMTLTREADGTSYRVVNHKTRLSMTFVAEGTAEPARLRSIRDAHDNAITLEYDGARLSRVVDTAGREVRVAWKTGRITRLEVRAEGQLQQWVDYGYSSSGCLTSVSDALGGTEEYEYDRHNRMVMAGLKTGVQLHYEYEANTGRCNKTWGPKGLYAVELTVDSASKTTIVDSEEPQIVTWNEQGLATRIALPDGTVREDLAYDADGLLVAKVNGAGEGEQYWYDERGNRVRIVDATGGATTWEFDGDDRPTRRVTPDGVETRFTHDSRGELTVIAFSSGESYALSYDQRGRLTEIRDGSGLIRGFEYDARHNVAVEIDGRGARTMYAYDEMGRAVARTDALGRTMRATHDRLGRTLSLRFTDGSTVSRSYTAAGKVAREIDGLGRVTTMEYSGMGVLTRLTEADGKIWEFKYTSQERLQQLKNPLGETYSFARDDAGRTVEETTFDGRKIAYTWSEAGRVSRITHADGGWRGLSYDRAGRLVGEQASDGSMIAYHRDRVGRVMGTSLEEGTRRITTAFERDEHGRVVVERQGDRTIRHAYDQRGRRIERILPGGVTTRYAFGADDRLDGVDHDGYRLTIERDVLGRPVQQISAEGQVTIRSEFDALDRLIEQRAIASSPESGVPAVLAQRQWQYDRNGKVTRIDDGRRGATAYQYDRSGALLESRRGAHREVFTYDPARSLIGAIEDQVGVSGWKVGPGNLLKQTDRAKYAYDARGRRIGKRALEQGTSTDDNITGYTWDCWDRLREVTLPDGARVVSTYDALGRRIRRESFAAGAASARIVEFLWDGDALAAEYDATLGTRCFVHRPGTLTPLLQQEKGEVFVYVNDHLGRPKELIDRSGAVVWAASHSAWGRTTEVLAGASPEHARGRAVQPPFGAPGQVVDEETGLCWTKFRCFDPEVGRWLSPDPLGIEGGRNLFALDGDPINSVDPLGLATSPTITAADLTGRTPDEIRQMASDRGLVEFGATPGRKWKDPVTGQERLRLDSGHIDADTGQPYNDSQARVPHVHGYDANGVPIRNPAVPDPNDATRGNKHFPTT
jgi:RHS repeat-associated protein